MRLTGTFWWLASLHPNSSQGHLASGGAGGLQGALSALAGTGVSEVAITELDIAGGDANDFATAVKACLAVSACVGITVCNAHFVAGAFPSRL